MVIHDTRTSILQAVWQAEPQGEGRSFRSSAPGATGAGLAFWSSAEAEAGTEPLSSHRGANYVGGPETPGFGHTWRQEAASAPVSARTLENSSPTVDLRTSWSRGRTGKGIERSLQLATADGLETITIVGATTTHTIKLNRAAGGMIHSWRVEKPSSSIDEDFINDGGGWMRGGQVGMEWVDDTTGEFTKNNPVQGGSYFSQSPQAVQEFQGSPLVEPIKIDGNKVTVKFQPLEFDPAGFYSIPGLHTDHGGALNRPVLWRDIVITVEYWFNFNGVENLHRIRTIVDFPHDVVTAHFDVSLYTMLCVRPDIFTRLWYMNKGDGSEGLISSGASGNPNYQANYRRYMMNSVQIAGDEETIPSDTSLIDSLNGSILAAGATAGDLAISIGGHLSEDVKTAKVINDWPGGNGWSWLQNRGGSDGAAGSNVILLSHGAFATGKFHSHTSARRIDSGTLQLDSFVATDTLTNVRTILNSIEPIP